MTDKTLKEQAREYGQARKEEYRVVFEEGNLSCDDIAHVAEMEHLAGLLTAPHMWRRDLLGALRSLGALCVGSGEHDGYAEDSGKVGG